MISRRSLLAAGAALPAALLAFKRGTPALAEPEFATEFPGIWKDYSRLRNTMPQAPRVQQLTGMDLAADVRRWLIHISPNPSRGPSIIRLPEREWRDLRATVETLFISNSWPFFIKEIPPSEPMFLFKGVPVGISETAARSAFWYGA